MGAVILLGAGASWVIQKANSSYDIPILQPVPVYSFINQDGNPFTEKDLNDKIKQLSFEFPSSSESQYIIEETDDFNVSFAPATTTPEFKEWFKDSLPNHSVPIKNDIKEYFIKLWGMPEKGYKWNNYRIRTLQDDLVNEESIIMNEEF